MEIGREKGKKSGMGKKKDEITNPKDSPTLSASSSPGCGLSFGQKVYLKRSVPLLAGEDPQGNRVDEFVTKNDVRNAWNMLQFSEVRKENRHPQANFTMCFQNPN